MLRCGDPAGIRTPDTLLKRQVLCLLSYWVILKSMYLVPLVSHSKPVVLREKERASEVEALPPHAGRSRNRQRRIANPPVISFKTCSFERKGASLRGGGFALSRRAKLEPAEAERRGWDGRTRTYNIRVKVWCVTVTLHPTIDLGREAGIAGLPHLLGWEMGLEPTTPGTTIRCSYQLSYTHHLEPCLGTPGGTRTPGLLLRRQLLYPAELLALI